MKVITAIGNDFDSLCDRLSKEIIKEFSPDVIIGVATGGRYVAERIEKNINVPLVIIKRQRNLTKKKSKLRLDSLLPLLPRSVNDLLRIAEIKFNERKFSKSGRILSVGSVAHISGDLEHLRGGKRILIVDDAVDSGGTFIDCINFLQPFLSENSVIKTAALNVTFDEPAFIPDFYLYKGYLIRYPWASDVRRKS